MSEPKTHIPFSTTLCKNKKQVYDLEANCGFFSQFFVFLSKYLTAKKEERIFYFNDVNWRYRNNLGMNDYFTIDNNKLEQELDRNNHMEFVTDELTNEFSLIDYREAIKDVYILKPKLITQYKTMTNIINLPEKYNSIYVRWGDKMISEAKYVDVSMYINKLISLNVDNMNLFINSDDYNAIYFFQEFINNHKLPFILYFIASPSEAGGTIVSEDWRGNFTHVKKSIEQFDYHERKHHTEKLLIAIEIMSKSQNIILDYQSNVSRFIKLYCDPTICTVHNVFGQEPDETIPALHPARGFRISYGIDILGNYVNIPKEYVSPKNPNTT